MQDLKALEGKSLVELREIAKAIGIGDTTLKKRELIEKIAGFSASEGAPAENKEKRGRGRKKSACRPLSWSLDGGVTGYEHEFCNGYIFVITLYRLIGFLQARY